MSTGSPPLPPPLLPQPAWGPDLRLPLLFLAGRKLLLLTFFFPFLSPSLPLQHRHALVFQHVQNLPVQLSGFAPTSPVSSWSPCRPHLCRSHKRQQCSGSTSQTTNRTVGADIKEGMIVLPYTVPLFWLQTQDALFSRLGNRYTLCLGQNTLISTSRGRHVATDDFSPI